MAYLTKNGIHPSRVFVKAFGSTYLFAKTYEQGQTNAISEKVNRRFELRLLNIQGLPLDVMYKLPELPEKLLNP